VYVSTISKHKEERTQAALMEYQRNMEKAAKLQQFGASATKASTAQSSFKQLERMQQQGLLDARQIRLCKNDPNRNLATSGTS
jgi:23S rRNA pseudoU1915 N3-methylase RlmH